MNIIETYNLSKFYKNACALSSVNMTIKKGEIYGLIGRNGAGKTTVMRILCGLTSPSEGSFSLFGATSPEALTANRQYMSAIIEAPALYKNFSARKNLQALAVLRGISCRSSVIDELIDFSGLTQVGDKKVKYFSLGMKQRLAIAMSLIGNPELLILDEPINGLDPVGIVEIRDMLKKLNREKGVTILISSHILSELAHLATCYGIIDRGNLIEEISAEELENKMEKTLNIVLQFKEDADKASVILKEQFKLDNFAVEGDTIAINGNVNDKSSEINMAFAKEGIPIKGISNITMDLERYFIEKTGGRL